MTTYYFGTTNRQGNGEIFASADGGPATVYAELGANITVRDIARAPDGTIYATVSDPNLESELGPIPNAGSESRVRKVDPDGTVSSVTDDLPEALFGLAFGADGTLYGAIRTDSGLTDIVTLDTGTFARIDTVRSLDLGNGREIDLAVRGDEVWATGTSNTGTFFVNTNDPTEGDEFLLQSVGGIAITDEGDVFIDRVGKSDAFDAIYDIEGGTETRFASAIQRTDAVTSDAYALPPAEPGVIRGTEGDDVLVGTARSDVLLGRGGDDLVFGREGNDNLFGGSGDDILVGDEPGGGSGVDTIFGGAGNDVIFGGAGADYLVAGIGTDQVVGGTGDDRIQLGDGDDIAFGGTGADDIAGERGTDVIFGEDGDDMLSGGAQTDYVSGGTGADTIDGGAGDDFLYGGEGGDRLTGGAGNDQMTGDAGRDDLRGEAGDDVLFGGDGNDSLTGGAGVDVFFGGAGADTVFVGIESGRDFWADFEDGIDRIQLQPLGVTRGSFGDSVDIMTVENATLVSVAGQQLFLEGIDAANVSAADFILVPFGELEEAEAF